MAIENVSTSSVEFIKNPIEITTCQNININIIRNVDLVAQATGLVVIIDVFRAFSTECFVFQNGAKCIIPVLTLDEARELKRLNPDYILMGERGGVKPDDFDYGNSPTEILNVDFTDKVVIHTTANGTKGMMNAIAADEIISGAFTNANAIVKHIKEGKSKEISLVSTSARWEEDNEDILLAYYIREALNGKIANTDEIKEILKNSSAAAFLLEEAKVPSTDIDLCLNFNRFNFIIKAVEMESMGNMKVLIKQDI